MFATSPAFAFQTKFVPPIINRNQGGLSHEIKALLIQQPLAREFSAPAFYVLLVSTETFLQLREPLFAFAFPRSFLPLLATRESFEPLFRLPQPCHRQAERPEGLAVVPQSFKIKRRYHVDTATRIVIEGASPSCR